MGLDTLFWAGKRVFLTGHTGFKGSWLLLWLTQLGAKVMGYALPATHPSLYTLANLRQLVEEIEGDICEPRPLLGALQEFQPEIVIHMAAQSLVRYSYQHPAETFQTNVMGTVHLLEAVRQVSSVRVVLVVTSDKCYENRLAGQTFSEDGALGGRDPYSSSKACQEVVTAAYRDSFFQPAESRLAVAIASARAGNVIGGGDWARDRLVPDIMQSFLNGEPALIRSPDAVRPWQFVLEPLYGYILLCEKLWQEGSPFASGWNFGPEREEVKPVAWIVEYLRQHWPGPPVSWHRDAASHPYEALFLSLNCLKAKTHLSWQPRIRLEQALDWILEWYWAYQQEGDMRAVSLSQLQRYRSLLP